MELPGHDICTCRMELPGHDIFLLYIMSNANGTPSVNIAGFLQLKEVQDGQGLLSQQLLPSHLTWKNILE